MQKLVFSLNTELSEIQQHVIILRFLEGFSLGETAAIVGKKVNNVKIIQNRGITKLRRCLGFRDDNNRYEESS
jgi:RNA polymerase sigma factor (sigma-70 family)